MSTFSGPMFEPSESQFWKSDNGKQGAHYNMFHLKSEEFAMDALRDFFKGGADEFNVCVFSTSGIHGMYNKIEQAEKHILNPVTTEDGMHDTCGNVTFLIIQPRICCLRYGNCHPKTMDDINFLKKLREDSHKELLKIGMPDAEA